ncbi:MAG: asparaginase [Anaerolineae bacterium]|jgi:L-asparaginase II|nr:asparaginase [Anaerolineae bacterium]MBT7191539.1 asparaginase [Anaerolineae bacterium]MBT7988499.1 asparaginase [Anaerolineae bacterium]
MQPYAPVLERTRGTRAESLHYAAAALVDSSGKLLAWIGNPRQDTFLRSSAKPFQAMPFIEQGYARDLGLLPRQISQICASHGGTDMHAEAVRGIQEKIDIDESFLQCGSHPPLDKETNETLIRRGEKPTSIRHNCSGKHTGMLAFAKMRGLPLDNYLDPEHPIQKDILTTFSEMCKFSIDKIGTGTDGCSAPNFSIPLYNTALGFARLCDPQKLPEKRADACKTITSAMMAHPEMVSGFGRFDTRLMQIGRGKLVAKTGAEGYQAVGILPGLTEAPFRAQASPKGVGIALKISDGDPKEAVRAAVMIEILRQFGILNKDELAELADEFGPVTEIFNWRKIKVGEAHPVFELERV